MRWTRLALLATAALILSTPARAQGADREAAAQAKTVDRLAAAIEKRIEGKVSPDDVRIEADWRRKSAIVTARVYGDGVGIWRDRTQFSLSRAQVLDLLRAIQAAHFGGMEKMYGGDESESESEHEKQSEKEREKEKQKEKVYILGSVSVRVGSDLKHVVQNEDGEHSKALATLAGKILGVSEKAAKAGVGATSLSDGLAKVASGKLAPQTLQIFVQNREDRSQETPAGGNWILRVDGRRVLDRTTTGPKASAQRLLVLSDEGFRKLAELVRDAEPQTLPHNLYSAQLVHVDIRLLQGRANLTARRYVGKTAETLGDKQVAFDRLLAGLAELHARVETQGALLPDGAE
jgi:hypothetical protein